MKNIICKVLLKIGIICINSRVVGQLKENINFLISQLNQAQKQKDEYVEKYGLITKIINSKPFKNRALIEFNELCEEGFNGLIKDVKAMQSLQNLQNELQVLCNFPNIYNKTTLALYGGINSGKTSFLNTLISNKFTKLATDNKPTTPIPTYITNGRKEQVKIHSIFGGCVDIKPALYSQISHNYIAKLRYNLKNIAPLMSLQTRIENFDNLCFIDTQGYESLKHFSSMDELKQYTNIFKNAQILLWFIDLDMNGTITKKDLDFLENLKDKSLYIILSKADLKSENEIRFALEETKNILKEFSIKYQGISAYSSKNKTEIMFEKISLFTFLQQENKVFDSKYQKQNELKNIFKTYFHTLQTTKTDIFDLSLTDLFKIKLDKMRETQEFIALCKNLEDKLLQSLNNFFLSLHVKAN